MQRCWKGRRGREGQGRINHLVCPKHSTTTGPTGKLDVEEGERVAFTQPTRGSGERCISYQLGSREAVNGFGEI